MLASSFHMVNINQKCRKLQSQCLIQKQNLREFINIFFHDYFVEIFSLWIEDQCANQYIIMRVNQSSLKTDHSRKQLSHNETIVLNALSVFSPLTTNLLSFENQLYTCAELLPRQIFKQFRKLRDDFEQLFSIVSSFSSQTTLFNQEKDKVLQDQIQSMEQQLKGSKVRSARGRASPDMKRLPLKQNQQPLKKSELLIKEVESLKNQLRRNDAEYEIQIKKYNYKFQEMQEEIDYYRGQCLKLENQLQSAERWEVQIRILKETKQRDQQLIRNMAWKLRNLEREKYGRSVFLSPNTSKLSLAGSSSRFHSPKSPNLYEH